MEHDRFLSVHETDGRYHLAKLVSRILEPDAIWAEHDQFRSATLRQHSLSDPPAPLSRDDHMVLALDIARKLETAGLIGARH